MCGRIVQKAGPLDYVEVIRGKPHRLMADLAGPRYNVPPGTQPLVLHRLDGEPTVERRFWGYAPSWHTRSPVSHARMAPRRSF